MTSFDVFTSKEAQPLFALIRITPQAVVGVLPKTPASSGSQALRPCDVWNRPCKLCIQRLKSCPSLHCRRQSRKALVGHGGLGCRHSLYSFQVNFVGPLPLAVAILLCPERRDRIVGGEQLKQRWILKNATVS